MSWRLTKLAYLPGEFVGTHLSHSWYSVFSLFWPVWLEVYPFYWSSQRSTFGFIDFSLFFFFVSPISALILITSFLLFTLGLISSSFSSFLKWKLRSLTCAQSLDYYSPDWGKTPPCVLPKALGSIGFSGSARVDRPYPCFVWALGSVLFDLCGEGSFCGFEKFPCTHELVST